jgi:hypothetical protein
MMAGTASRIAKLAWMIGLRVKAGVLDGDARERRIGQHHAVEAHQPKQAAVELVSAAAVVAVEQHQLRAHLVKLPAFQVFGPGEAQTMLLEALAGLVAHGLLDGAHRQPAAFPHALQDGTGGEKGIAIRNAWDRLRGEDRRGKAFEVLIG